MTYDYELTLIDQTYTENAKGDSIPAETRRNVLCGKKSVTRSEFYSAARAGIKPEIVLVVHDFEYEDEKKVEFEGNTYKVIKTYPVAFEEIELTCERV